MKSKRFIAAVLGLTMLLAVFGVPVQAREKDAVCDCGEVLQVWVDGFGQKLYFNEGTPRQKDAPILVTDKLGEGLKWLLLGGALAARYDDPRPLTGGLGQLVEALFGHLALDTNGNSVAPVSCNWVIREGQVKNHARWPEFTFRYDYRMDPMDSAQELNAFIEALCEKTGHDKIALTGHSQGSSVVMAYIAAHGTKRLDTLIISNGGWRGLAMAGQLFNREIKLDPAAITAFIANSDNGSGTLTAAMDMLRLSGLLDFIPELADGLDSSMLESLFVNHLRPIFCHMPSIWTFIPQESLETALKLLLDHPEYDGLKAKIYRYRKEVFLKAPDLLRQAKADGVKVAVIAAYGPAPVPVTKDTSYLCDSLIDTASMSGGATTAAMGTTLPPGKPKYRSPDNMVDAATCVLPDQTWFIKGNVHDEEASQALRLWIIHSEKTPDVFANPDFPQYLQRTRDGKSAVPLTGNEPARVPPETMGAAAKDFAKSIFSFN